MSTDYTEHIDEAMEQLPNNPAVVPADNRTPQSPNITLEAWNRLQARLVTLETLVAKLGKGGFATAVQTDVSALGESLDTGVDTAIARANAYTDTSVAAEQVSRETADATKVDKTTNADRLYGTDSFGDPKEYKVSTDPETADVPKYMQGRLQVSETMDSLDAANKAYVDQADNAKLDKITSATGIPRVYGISASGQQEVFDVREAAVGGTVASRNSAGQIGVATPTANNHAANKYYVDTGLSAKVDKNHAPDTYPRALTSRLLNGEYTETYQRISHLADGSTLAARDSGGHLATASPTQTYHAANKDYVDTVVTSQIGRVYKPAGSISFAELLNTVSLDAAHLGNIYNIRNNFTTTNDFSEGPGIEYPAGTNVGVVQDGAHYYFDVFVGQIDLSNYVTKTDYATASEPGVIQVGQHTYGLQMVGAALRTSAANASDIKLQKDTFRPIVPVTLPQSVFYGLSLAAGVNLASSTEETAPYGNYPGVYPAAAVQAILKMLLPAAPTTDGTYDFVCTVTNGEPTFSWVART